MTQSPSKFSSNSLPTDRFELQEMIQQLVLLEQENGNLSDQQILHLERLRMIVDSLTDKNDASISTKANDGTDVSVSNLFPQNIIEEPSDQMPVAMHTPRMIQVRDDLVARNLTEGQLSLIIDILYQAEPRDEQLAQIHSHLFGVGLSERLGLREELIRLRNELKCTREKAEAQKRRNSLAEQMEEARRRRETIFAQLTRNDPRMPIIRTLEQAA